MTHTDKQAARPTIITEMMEDDTILGLPSECIAYILELEAKSRAQAAELERVKLLAQEITIIGLRVEHGYLLSLENFQKLIEIAHKS